MKTIKYIVKYRVHEYESFSGPNREESFDNLDAAIKRRNRINRYMDRAERETLFLSPTYMQRSDEFHRAMTDSCAFIYTGKAMVVERTTEERKIA